MSHGRSGCKSRLGDYFAEIENEGRVCLHLEVCVFKKDGSENMIQRVWMG